MSPLSIAAVFFLLVLPALYVGTAALATTPRIKAINILPPFVDSGERAAHHPSARPRIAVVVSVLIGMTVILCSMAVLVYWLPVIIDDFMYFATILLVGDLIGRLLAPARLLDATPVGLGRRLLNLGRYFVGFAVAWVVVGLVSDWSNWLSLGVIALACAASAMLSFSRISARLLALVSVALVCYDAIHVFGTGLMQVVADQAYATSQQEGAIVIGMVNIPSALDLAAPTSVAIGLGDIVTPGLWVMVAALTTQHPNTVMFTTIVGIMIGWIACLTVSELGYLYLPALIFLMPGSMAGYYIGNRLHA